MKSRLMRLFAIMLIPSLVFAGNTYTVTVKNGSGYAEDSVTGSTVEGTTLKVSGGSWVELEAAYPQDEHNEYAFSGWAVSPASAQALIFNEESGNSVESEDIGFAMPSNNITLTAVWIKNPVGLSVEFAVKCPDGYMFDAIDRAIEFSLDGKVWHQLRTYNVEDEYK